MNTSTATGPTAIIVRRRWGRRLLLWSLLSVLALGALVGAVGAAAWQTVPELSQMAEGLRISIDGHPIKIGTIDPLHVWVAGVVLVSGLALLFTLLPLLLAAAVLAVICAVGGTVVLGLLAAAGVAALVLSPLIAAALLAWWLLRRRPQRNGARTTMAS